MALDYYIEIENFGTEEKKEQIRHLIVKDLSLHEYKDTKLVSGQGLSISFFVDDDGLSECDEPENIKIPALTVNLRVEKNKLEEQGYILLRKVLRKILNATEEDLCLIDDYENILFKRKSSKTFKMCSDHDVWQCGAI